VGVELRLRCGRLKPVNRYFNTQSSGGTLFGSCVRERSAIISGQNYGHPWHLAPTPCLIHPLFYFHPGIIYQIL
jgi:hypothetical protein